MAASWRAAGLALMAALAGCISPAIPRPAYVPSKPESFAQQIMNAADFVALRNADSPDGLHWTPESGETHAPGSSPLAVKPYRVSPGQPPDWAYSTVLHAERVETPLLGMECPLG